MAGYQNRNHHPYNMGRCNQMAEYACGRPQDRSGCSCDRSQEQSSRSCEQEMPCRQEVTQLPCEQNRMQMPPHHHHKVAMAYVPWQEFARLYDISRGYEAGTIFQDLDKPFCGKGGMMGA